MDIWSRFKCINNKIYYASCRDSSDTAAIDNGSVSDTVRFFLNLLKDSLKFYFNLCRVAKNYSYTWLRSILPKVAI